MKLLELGWDSFFENDFEEGKKTEYIPGRIVREDRGRYIVAHENGECTATISGRMRHNTVSMVDFPAVGDWVSMSLINDCEEGIIYSVLKRKSKLTRKAAVSGGRKVRDVMGRKITLGGATDEQVVAANVDEIFILVALDETFNLRRLERFILMVYNSGAMPVIVLNKIDICDDVESKIVQVEEIAPGIEIHAISAIDNIGVDGLRDHLKKGKTIGLFGTSGAGKSTLTNAFLNEEILQTGDVRETDGKGRHTTTWREIVLIPTGGIIIDTPGMRELQIWSDGEELDNMFGDIVELESECKYRNCSHKVEPGCAVQRALKNGELDEDRYNNYLIMKLEVDYLSGRKKEKKAYTEREKFIESIKRRDKGKYA